MASAAPFDGQAVIAKVKTLINAQLKTILKKENLPVSGVKAAMQERIITSINNAIQHRNFESFSRIKALVNNPEASPSSTASRSFHSNGLSPSAHTQSTMVHNYTRPPGSYMSHTPQSLHAPASPNFKNSPFYSILERLTPVQECKAINLQPVREQTRDQVDCKINLRTDTVEKLNSDPTLKVMVYCAAETPGPTSSAVDISFPHQVEVRVNLDEVKANLRGLKNKPGSTRPADITGLLRKRANYENTMTVTYALTQKKFYLVVNLVKQHPVDELVAKLQNGKSISKQQVIREMTGEAQDNDLVQTSSVMSLKCPLSTLRIEVPCRSLRCTHRQCFDASSFLQLQEQAPTWKCPLCNEDVSFDALLVDEYMNDILMNTARSVEQVTVEPDGRWSRISQTDAPSNQGGARSSSDDEDLVEIQDLPRVAAVKNEATLSSASMTRTPPYPSREQSEASIPSRPTTGKRPHGQTIDLTISSDEDEEPIRPPKRQSTQNSLNGHPSLRSVPLSGIETPPSRGPNGYSFTLPRPTLPRTPGSSEYLGRSYVHPP